MVEDKLNQAQRIRLESLTQSQIGVPFGTTAEVLIERAKKFETFITGEETTSLEEDTTVEESSNG